MDVIKNFNQELLSLYETKPPISKAKITAITRSAIRAIKFYKHVVQSVEKFIIKCKPEYKVPALYVIDSLVRQSRHQFQDKDVFGPRFARNLKLTFQNLYQVSPDDKSKIIRVLNLWQKNEVFTPDVIHPLFDMADPNHPIHQELAEAQARNGVEGGNKSFTGVSNKHGPDALGPLSGKTLNQNDLLQQLHHLQSLLQNHGNEKDAKVKFDKKLLDFDYGEEENDDDRTQSASDALGNILKNPEVLRQLQALQNQTQSQYQKIDFESLKKEREKKEQEMALQEKEFDKHLAATVPKLPFASVCEFNPDDVASAGSSFHHYNVQATSTFPNVDMTVPPPGYPKKEQTDFDERVPPFVQTTAVISQPVVIDLDKIDSGSDSNDKTYRKRSHRSRSTSRSRSWRHRSRSGSRSRSSRRRRSRSYDREEKIERFFDKEKEAERRKKALPPFRKNYLAVCSTTLWIGHLSKLVQEEELSDTFGEYGDVVSINLIPPRGCAFVCMNRRQDAAKALHKLKNTKLQGKTITLAWAPGKGMKDKDWKDFWEVQDGVSYIPYDRLNKDIDYDYVEDGGVFDEDTVPLWLKDHLKSVRKKREDETQNDTETPTVSSTKGDVQSGPSGSEAVAPSFIPLPETPKTEGQSSLLPLASSPLPVTPVPPAVTSVAPAVSQPNSASLPALLMPQFGISRLLGGPMGMTMGPATLMPNVPLGVPPPGLFKIHQQLLNRLPPPGNLLNQNLGDFPEGILPLPFSLQHIRPNLQPGTAVTQSNTDGVDKPGTDPILNVFGGSGALPFHHIGRQFPPNLPLMSVPPPNVVPSIQNLSVPPPAIVKKEEDVDDDDVVMEDIEKKPDDLKVKKEDRESDNRVNYGKEDRNNRDKYREKDRYHERDKHVHERDRNEKGDRWGGRNNREVRTNNNNTPRKNNRDGNNRSSRWNQECNDRPREDFNEKPDNEDVKPWNRSSNRNNTNSNNNDTMKFNRDEHLNQPPPNFMGNSPTMGPPGLMRLPPPPFMRPPGPPHMFRPRFEAPNNNGHPHNEENFERFPLEPRFPPGGPRRHFDNIPPRGPPFMLPPGDSFPPRFSPRGPPPPFIRPDIQPPRPLMGIRPPHVLDPRLPGQDQFRPKNSEQFRTKNQNPFGPRELGLMGGMPKRFKLQGKGAFGEEVDTRPSGRRNSWRNEQRYSGQNHSLQPDSEPRTKRSRWGENSNEAPAEIDTTEKKCASTIENVDNSIEESLVTNVFVDKPLPETLHQTNVLSDVLVSSDIQQTIEPSTEIKPDSIMQTIENPDVTVNTEMTSKLEEPMSKEAELPTQGPGDTDESFTKTDGSKASAISNEEIVCDSTVD